VLSDLSATISFRECIAVLEYTQVQLGVANVREVGIDSDHQKVGVHRSAGVLSEQVWQRLLSWSTTSPSGLGVLSAPSTSQMLVPISHGDLVEEMQSLCHKQSDFHWARLRALVDGMIRHFTQSVVADSSQEVLTNLYQDQLTSIGGHWFRKTAALHIGIGFHTAVSALFKSCATYTEVYWRLYQPKHSFASGLRPFLQLLSYIASCHLVVLHASDGIFWDSAGVKNTNAIGCRVNEGQTAENTVEWHVRSQTVQEIILRAIAHYNAMPEEPRVGCPALKSWGALDGRLFSKTQEWIVSLFEKYALPAIAELPLPLSLGDPAIELLGADKNHCFAKADRA
jgi:hypothetical protein